MQLFAYDMHTRSRGEMDIIPVFGTVVGGSNPSGSTKSAFLRE